MSNPSERGLVPRFAFTTLAVFLAVGIALWVAVAATIDERIESASEEHAEFVTHSVIGPALEGIDLDRSLGPAEPGYDRMRRLVVTHILRVQFPVVRVKLWAPDGTVLFSDEPGLVGRVFPVTPELRGAFAGRVASVPEDPARPENAFDRPLADEILATYVPLSPPRPGMDPAVVVEIDTDIAAAAVPVGRPFRMVGMALLAGLAAIYVVQLPLVRRLGRTLRRQNQRLEVLLGQERQTVEELRTLTRRQAQFLDVTSHELRTPITSIAGYAKTLLDPEFRDDANMRQEFLGAIERQAGRLGTLVENILAATKLSEKAGQAGMASVREAVVATLEQLGGAAQRVGVDMPDDLPDVHLDPRQLELVVANLVENALKFSPDGSPCSVGARLDGGDVVLRIEDQGIGIAPDHIEKVFDRFYQVDSSTTRRYGGMGLGLHLVKAIVEEAGGTIEVTSVPGEGARFTVRLAAVDAPVTGTAPAHDPGTIMSELARQPQ